MHELKFFLNITNLILRGKIGFGPKTILSGFELMERRNSYLLCVVRTFGEIWFMYSLAGMVKLLLPREK